jgi:hypothetical protein
MARRVSVSVENNFRGALNTEATGLNFPENACTETINCVHDEKGRTKRRFGFNFEAGYDTNTVEKTDKVITGYTWQNVAGDGSLSLRVQQVGATLYFYHIAQAGALSDNLLATTVSLTTFKTAVDVDPALNECLYASAAGFLLVTHPQCEPFYVSFDAETLTATATQITVEIRDQEGVDDSLDINERPTATVAGLTAAHKYNLFNQGWHFNSNAALTAWDTAFTTMPSNSDVWWLFKNSNNEFDTTQVANTDTGNAPAPRGHYILNVHDQDRTTASGIANITTVTTGTSRVAVCAFHAGRAFYAGLASQGYSSKIYFSQIIENPDQFGRCYQANDPTSEDLSDLLPTDGGYLTIYGVESVVAMIPLSNSLLVFATNGIWAILGSDGIGFTATDFTVTKLSSVSAINAYSFVDIEGFPMWWNLNGIYALVPGGTSNLQFDVKSVTDDVIKSYMDDIPIRSKAFVRGVYNPLTKLVRWIFRSTEATSVDEDYTFDSVLTYSFLTQGFFPWTITTGNVEVHDIFILEGLGGIQSFDTVVELGEGPGDTWTRADDIEIQDSTGDVVTVFSISSFLIEPTFKYFCSYDTGDGLNSEVTFAEEYSASYLDWLYFDDIGQDYDSTFTVGYKLHSDTQRFFQSNYVFVFLEQEEQASCTVRGLWEWTTSESSERWSNAQQIYNSALLYRSVNFRRLKIRGKGRALQLKFDSETGKPFTIIGWSLFETQNASI